MPRKLRVEYGEAIYHVMNRGDRREPIFQDDKDRECFIATLGEVCGKTGWQVHAFCLMLRKCLQKRKLNEAQELPSMKAVPCMKNNCRLHLSDLLWERIKKLT